MKTTLSIIGVVLVIFQQVLVYLAITATAAFLTLMFGRSVYEQSAKIHADWQRWRRRKKFAA